MTVDTQIRNKNTMINLLDKSYLKNLIYKYPTIIH
jgi:hypothetical protein